MGKGGSRGSSRMTGSVQTCNEDGDLINHYNISYLTYYMYEVEKEREKKERRRRRRRRKREKEIEKKRRGGTDKEKRKELIDNRSNKNMKQDPILTRVHGRTTAVSFIIIHYTTTQGALKCPTQRLSQSCSSCRRRKGSPWAPPQALTWPVRCGWQGSWDPDTRL